MDLLRAIAILLVILAHSVLSYGAPAHLAPLQLGGTGVDLFFVLSGWLLGSVLIKEAIGTGDIDVRRFWKRRWMRTLPAYFTVLIMSVSQRLITKDGAEFPWEYFVFLQNYKPHMEFFSISWSLAVEEQFYLFIAPLLAFLIPYKKHNRTLILLILLFAPFILRSLDLYVSGYETHVRIDGCVLGVLLAHIRLEYEKIWRSITCFAPQLAFATMFVYVCLYVLKYFPEVGVYDAEKLVLALIFGSWVVLANSSDGWSEKLYLPGAYYVATRSYSLYLLHPEVLALLRRIPFEMPFPAYMGIALAGSFFAAEFLYRFVEKPVMDFRERLPGAMNSKVAHKSRA